MAQLEKKKVSNFYNHLSSLPTLISFLLTQLTFLIKTESYKSTLIEYLDVTALLQSLDLTAL